MSSSVKGQKKQLSKGKGFGRVTDFQSLLYCLMKDGFKQGQCSASLPVPCSGRTPSGTMYELSPKGDNNMG